MPNSKNVHVVPDGNGWAVKREGNPFPYSVHNTQGDAIDSGRDLRGPSEGDLIIHRRDGRIRGRDTAPKGHDPFPPSG